MKVHVAGIAEKGNKVIVDDVFFFKYTKDTYINQTLSSLWGAVIVKSQQLRMNIMLWFFGKILIFLPR